MSDEPSYILTSTYHLLTLLLWCIGEFAFVNRAVLAEIHSDLLGAAGFSLAIAVAYVVESIWASMPAWRFSKPAVAMAIQPHQPWCVNWCNWREAAPA